MMYIRRRCATMKAGDVTGTLEMALEASGLDRANVAHGPQLLSDNASSYFSADLADWLDDRRTAHVRGAPYHPQTQGKIPLGGATLACQAVERWHQSLKSCILLENYYLPGDLEARIEALIDHYNHRRYHESLSDPAPADVYFGRGQVILLE